MWKNTQDRKLGLQNRSLLDAAIKVHAESKRPKWTIIIILCLGLYLKNSCSGERSDVVEKQN